MRQTGCVLTGMPGASRAVCISAWIFPTTTTAAGCATTTRCWFSEEICFPLAEQAALLLRQTEGRKDERVALITGAGPSRLDAPNWLRLNRDAWGIESGLHQRLDISHNDDRCRVRNDNAMLVLGMMLRLSNSLFMQWSSYQRRPDHVTTTDFQSALSEDHHRPALRLALSKYPNLKRLS